MKRASLSVALIVLLAACTSQQVGQETPQFVNPVPDATLQFAVGTYYVDPSMIIAGSGDENPGLNIVGTFRNPAGLSDVLDDDVSIYGPPTFTAYPGTPPYDGGASNEVLKSLKGTQLFGDSFGLVNSALDANLNVSDPKPGTPASLAPFVAGPPAWPSVTGGLYPQQLVGYPESVLTTPMLVEGIVQSPVAGTWTLEVTVPMNTSAGTYAPSMTATATLTNTTPLPLFTAPSFVPDGNGGGTVTLTVPAGVTEAFVNFVVTYQLCYPPPAVQNPEFDQVTSYYTLMTRATGTQTLVLPDNLGPPSPKTGNPLHTICTSADNQNPLNPGSYEPPYTGATYSIDAVGVDYPAYEMSYPQSRVPNPTITGTSGQADATVSKTLFNLVYP
jgi:hypothetical protein